MGGGGWVLVAVVVFVVVVAVAAAALVVSVVVGKESPTRETGEMIFMARISDEAACAPWSSSSNTMGDGMTCPR